ncbi:MAG: response regulator [Chloroflexi bacterium]|nr:response regulator [Chloroflexota bacterium]
MGNLIRILHLENDAGDLELVRATLESSDLTCQITAVQTRDEFSQALSQGGYDVIFADYRLPGYDGRSALRLTLERCPEVPFIFVSGTIGEDAAINGLTDGATDYVLKQKLSRLVPAVTRALREAENRRARKRAEESLKKQYSTLRSIIDSTNALIFSVDQQYRYTSFNKGHAAVMHALYGAEIETGRSILGYMTVTVDREIAHRNLDRALAGEQLVEEAYSGEELKSRRYFQVSHSPIKTEMDEVIGVAVISQDLTERKHAEEKIKHQLNELQRWHDVTLNREGRVQELKHEVNQLCARLGEPLRYPSQAG